jgi:hypothetical protein
VSPCTAYVSICQHSTDVSLKYRLKKVMVTSTHLCRIFDNTDVDTLEEFSNDIYVNRLKQA